MGIFSNRCEALVNPVTGLALTGAALKAAQSEPSWPRCGSSVSKSAHICSACGAPAPGAWVKCPKCGEWVGNDSHFCWNCSTPLHPDSRAGMANGVWQRSPGVFAQQFESNEMQTKDGSQLQVQEGTSAILISGGAVEDVLDAGRFNVESVARKINWFGNPPNRSAILLETRESALPIEVKDMPTKAGDDNVGVAGMSIDFYGETVVQFSGGKAAGVAFVQNAMAGRRELTFADLTERIKSLSAGVIRDYCRQRTLEELLTDAEGRENLRQEISRKLEDEFSAIGLDLVRMSSAEFKSAAYRALERSSGELDAKRREEEYRMAAEELLRKLKLRQLKDEHAFRVAKEALEREHQIGDADSERAWQQLLQERDDAALRDRRTHELQQQKEQRDFEVEKAKLDAERDRRMEDARNEEENRRWEREMIRKAREEEEAEKRRKKEAEERVRAEQEAESARIREWAKLEDEQNHRWTMEDKNLKRSWATEIERLQHDGEVAMLVRRAAKARLDDEITAEKVRIELETLKGDFKRTETLKDAEASANVKKVTAKANLDIRKDEHAQDVTEAASGIGLMQRRMKAILDEIKEAVRNNDEKTAEMLREQYRAMVCG